MRLYFTIILLFSSFQLFSEETTKQLTTFISELKENYNTKLNDAFIDINLEKGNNKIMIQGFVSDSTIFQDLSNFINSHKITNTDMTGLFVSDLEYSGVINVSVADLHTKPSFSSSVSTQELLGTKVKILAKQDSWFLIQCPNKYFGWISEKQIIEEKHLSNWENYSKIIFTSSYGVCYALPQINQLYIVSDLVKNNVLSIIEEEKEFYKVCYPDKRIGYVKKSDTMLLSAIDNTTISINEVMNSVFEMNGLPYIWGGLSTKGMDCSGLVSAAFRSNGYFTYRDASQQALVGENVSITPNYENLNYGDLLFFGKSENQIRHVGFYVGNKRFIHASGFVRTSSLDPTQPEYDELNTKELVLVKRYISDNKTNGIFKINYTNY